MIDIEKTCKEKDLVSSVGSFILLWGPGIVIITLASMGGEREWWSETTGSILLAIGILWIGISCHVNGRRCGRAHCKILGIAFPLLALVAVLMAFGVIDISWNTFSIIFWIILIGSFIPEFFGKKYL